MSDRTPPVRQSDMMLAVVSLTAVSPPLAELRDREQD